MSEFRQTKEDCQASISGVCSGCGAVLEPIETVDNSGNPTFWPHCPRCGVYDNGVDFRHFAIARELVRENIMQPYSGKRPDNENSDEFAYWMSSQCRGLSSKIGLIHKRLKADFSDDGNEKRTGGNAADNMTVWDEFFKAVMPIAIQRVNRVNVPIETNPKYAVELGAYMADAMMAERDKRQEKI